MIDLVANYILGSVHPVVWVCIGIVLLGVAWNFLGWKGLLGVVVAITHGVMFIWGWRERNKGFGHVIPKGDKLIGRVEPEKPRKIRTVQDMWNDWRNR